jgi:hypothetical protein
MMKTKPEVRFDNGAVDRRFTDEWSQTGWLNTDKLPEMVASVIEQRKAMLGYIEALHDKLDYLLVHNECCDVAGCLTAGCGSDHK